MGHARPIQLLWFVGAAVFLLALFHSMGGQSSEWVNSALKQTTSLTSGGSLKDVKRPTLRQHAELAEKIWEKTVRQRHEMRKDWPDQDNMPFFPATDADRYRKTPYSIWDFVPASYPCPWEMERIGRMGDGGKWVCGMSQYEAIPEEKPCVIYSFGVQTESSFEEEMITRTHCEIWAYDFSVVDFGKQLNASHRDRAHFTQAGIAGQTDTTKEPPFYSIQDLMRNNGHEYIDVLKMDIEYAEFESLSSLSTAFSKSLGMEFPVGQIMIEIHLFGAQGITAGQFLGWWENLEDRGMRATWTEPNLLSTTLHLEDGMTRLAEYTWINAKDSNSVLLGALHSVE